MTGPVVATRHVGERAAWRAPGVDLDGIVAEVAEALEAGRWSRRRPRAVSMRGSLRTRSSKQLFAWSPNRSRVWVLREHDGGVLAVVTVLNAAPVRAARRALRGYS